MDLKFFGNESMDPHNRIPYQATRNACERLILIRKSFYIDSIVSNESNMSVLASHE